MPDSHSADRLWRCAAPSLTRPLLDPDLEGRVGALIRAAGYPARVLYLECRLDGPAPIDVSFQMPVAAYRDLAPAGPWPEVEPDHVVLECDLDRAADPAVFWPLGLPAGAAALHRFLARIVPTDTLAAARSYLDSLPPAARIDHAAVMAARAGRPLRLNISASPLASCPGGRPPALVAELAGMADGHALALDITGSGLSGRWGVELFLRADAGPDAWAVLLARLTDAGLCDPARARAALAWPGLTPGEATPMDRLLGRWPVLWRDIAHVKIVVEAGRLAAKVYLACAWRTLPPGVPAQGGPDAP